jgi:molybdate transport system substrate-binding protein
MGGGPESIPVRLARGETADILILNRPPLDELTDAGHIRPESRVDLVRSVIGMAVRSGAPKPDISTREALIETLLAAIGYSASVSGTYLYLDSLNGRVAVLVRIPVLEIVLGLPGRQHGHRQGAESERYDASHRGSS